jgi:hypothetical protein
MRVFALVAAISTCPFNSHFGQTILIDSLPVQLSQISNNARAASLPTSLNFFNRSSPGSSCQRVKLEIVKGSHSGLSADMLLTRAAAAVATGGQFGKQAENPSIRTKKILNHQHC